MTRLGLGIFICLGLGGCANNLASFNPENIYLHEPELEQAAKNARDAFDKAKTTGLWDTMLANYEKGAAVQRQGFQHALELAYEGHLVVLGGGDDGTTWGEIYKCAEGECADLDDDTGGLSTDERAALGTVFGSGKTADKLKKELLEISRLAEEIEKLKQLIKDDPDGSKTTGDITHSPSSTFSLLKVQVEKSIANVDKSLKESIEGLYNDLKNAIDSIDLPEDVEADLRKDLGDLLGKIKDGTKKVSTIRSANERALAIFEKYKEKVPPQVGKRLGEIFGQVGEPWLGKLSSVLDRTDAIVADAEKLVNAILDEDTSAMANLASTIDILRKSENFEILKVGSLGSLLGLDHKLPGNVTSRLAKVVGNGDVARGKKRIQEALGKDTLETIGDVLTLMGNGNAKDLLTGLSVKELLESAKQRSLSTEFQNALAEHTGRKGDKALKSIGDVLDYLTTDESKLQEIRLSLLKDWRKALVEMRATELSNLTTKLTMTQSLVGALKAQEVSETDLKSGYDASLRDLLHDKEGARGRKALMTSVTRGSVSLLKDDLKKEAEPSETFGDLPIHLTLDAFARNYAPVAFENWAIITAEYFARIGYLRERELLVRMERIRYEHKTSIERSQVGAQAREQLISRGLDGLVTFTEGGITSNDIASVIRFLQTGLLGVISVTTLD